MMAEQDTPLFESLWDYQHPEETAVQVRDLLPEVEASGDAEVLAQLLTQLARTHSLRRNFDEAHQILDRVEGMLTPAMASARIRYLLERGRTHNSAGERERAAPLFTAAYELALRHEADFFAIDAAHMMGIAAPPEAQLDWSLKAVALAEKTSHRRARQWLGALYNNIGWTYHDLGQYEQALSFLERALAWFDTEAEPRQAQKVNVATWSVARAQRSLGQFEIALQTQLALLDAWPDAGSWEGYVQQEIGECLLALDRGEAARPYFARAHAVLSEDAWLVEHQPARLARLRRLADAAGDG